MGCTPAAQSCRSNSRRRRRCLEIADKVEGLRLVHRWSRRRRTWLHPGKPTRVRLRVWDRSPACQLHESLCCLVVTNRASAAVSLLLSQTHHQACPPRELPRHSCSELRTLVPGSQLLRFGRGRATPLANPNRPSPRPCQHRLEQRPRRRLRQAGGGTTTTKPPIREEAGNLEALSRQWHEEEEDERKAERGGEARAVAPTRPAARPSLAIWVKRH